MVGGFREVEEQPSLHGPASAIQNTCSHTAVSATQITCFTQHLLEVSCSLYSGNSGRLRSWWRLRSLGPIPTGCHAGTRALGFPLGGRPVIRLDLAAATRTGIFARTRADLPNPSECLSESPMGRAQHAGSQHRSRVHST